MTKNHQEIDASSLITKISQYFFIKDNFNGRLSAYFDKKTGHIASPASYIILKQDQLLSKKQAKIREDFLEKHEERSFDHIGVVEILKKNQIQEISPKEVEAFLSLLDQVNLEIKESKIELEKIEKEKFNSLDGFLNWLISPKAPEDLTQKTLTSITKNPIIDLKNSNIRPHPNQEEFEQILEKIANNPTPGKEDLSPIAKLAKGLLVMKAVTNFFPLEANPRKILTNNFVDPNSAAPTDRIINDIAISKNAIEAKQIKSEPSFTALIEAGTRHIRNDCQKSIKYFLDSLPYAKTPDELKKAHQYLQESYLRNGYIYLYGASNDDLEKRAIDPKMALEEFRKSLKYAIMITGNYPSDKNINLIQGIVAYICDSQTQINKKENNNNIDIRLYEKQINALIKSIDLVKNELSPYPKFYKEALYYFLKEIESHSTIITKAIPEKDNPLTIEDYELGIKYRQSALEIFKKELGENAKEEKALNHLSNIMIDLRHLNEVVGTKLKQSDEYYEKYMHYYLKAYNFSLEAAMINPKFSETAERDGKNIKSEEFYYNMKIFTPSIVAALAGSLAMYICFVAPTMRDRERQNNRDQNNTDQWQKTAEKYEADLKKFSPELLKDFQEKFSKLLKDTLDISIEDLETFSKDRTKVNPKIKAKLEAFEKYTHDEMTKKFLYTLIVEKDYTIFDRLSDIYASKERTGLDSRKGVALVHLMEQTNTDSVIDFAIKKRSELNLDSKQNEEGQAPSGEFSPKSSNKIKTEEQEKGR